MKTKGATSFVFVTLDQLNKFFNGNAIIPISRKFANNNHLLGQAMYATNDNIVAAGNPPAIEEKVSIKEVVEDPPIQIEEKVYHQDDTEDADLETDLRPF